MIKYTQVENKFIHFIYLLISHTFVVPLPDNPDKRYNNSPNNWTDECRMRQLESVIPCSNWGNNNSNDVSENIWTIRWAARNAVSRRNSVSSDKD